jgi:hypothetical protein
MTIVRRVAPAAVLGTLMSLSIAGSALAATAIEYGLIA